MFDYNNTLSIQKEKIGKKKRSVTTQIIQSVAFNLVFPSCKIPVYSNAENKIFVNHKYIHSYEYGFMLKSVVNGYNCKPLLGDDLYNNAINQNETTYHKLINECIEMYKKEIGVEDYDFHIEKYESPTVRREYTRKVEEYFEKI